MSRTVVDVAKTLDHAVLKPELTAADLAKQAAMCGDRGVGCLCVRSCDVAEAARLAIADGARELDMVMNVGALKSGRETLVRDDIAAVVAAAKPAGVLVKVILETCYLTPDEIRAACRLAEEAGADFVKTSTGFGIRASGPTGATPEAVQIMLDAVGGRLQVKASGGIRTWADAVSYLDMGCTRLGVGDAAAILDGRPAAGTY